MTGASYGSIGPYEIVAELKGGGMAALYLGVRSGPAGFRRPVAIKVIRPHLIDRKASVEMFLDEARIASRISHPNVVHIEELGETARSYYLAMEYVHGTSLANLLRNLIAMQRKLTPAMSAALVMRIAAGLHAAHEILGEDGRPLNVVHRDVSPQNVLLSVQGQVKLIDFGIAKARGRLHKTMGNELKGKLRYMAPEQLMGTAVDRRADVYALGVVLWELLTMRRLFSRTQSDVEVIQRIQQGDLPPPGAFSDVPFEVDRLVLDCLSADPERRPRTAGALRQRLRAIVPEAGPVSDGEIAALVWGVVGHELETVSLPVPLPRRTDAQLDCSPQEAIQRFTREIVEDDDDAHTAVVESPMLSGEMSMPPPPMADPVIEEEMERDVRAELQPPPEVRPAPPSRPWLVWVVFAVALFGSASLGFVLFHLLR